jgi:hypothetical protein
MSESEIKQEEESSVDWFYKPWFFWSFTVLQFIAGVVFTVMLITADRVTAWYGYIIGPAFLLGGTMTVVVHFLFNKIEAKEELNE